MHHSLREHAEQGLDEVAPVDEVGVGLLAELRPCVLQDRCSAGREDLEVVARRTDLGDSIEDPPPVETVHGGGRNPMPAPTSRICDACSYTLTFAPSRLRALAAAAPPYPAPTMAILRFLISSDFIVWITFWTLPWPGTKSGEAGRLWCPSGSQASSDRKPAGLSSSRSLRVASSIPAARMSGIMSSKM
ncbi:hypothetical protein AHiyo8_06370 [Arthrobacter sp. Hiyo8]|nr:hypothetical protein AHiyo8_06370 [Arthrobacter sp. Hiyo8]